MRSLRYLVLALAASCFFGLVADVPASAWPWSGSNAPATSSGLAFSPVSYWEAVVDAGLTGGDSWGSEVGPRTTGVGFTIYDTAKVHTCSGIRFKWVSSAGAGPVWGILYTAGSSPSTVTSGQVTTTATNGEFQILWGPAVDAGGDGGPTGPVTLQPGVVYVAALYAGYDVIVGNTGSAQSVVGMFAAQGNAGNRMIANSFLAYIMPPYNGGGTYSPYSLYTNGTGIPTSISSNIFPLEPIVQ